MEELEVNRLLDVYAPEESRDHMELHMYAEFEDQINLEGLRASNVDTLSPLLAGDLTESQLLAAVNHPNPPLVDSRPHPTASYTPIALGSRYSDCTCDDDVEEIYLEDCLDM